MVHTFGNFEAFWKDRPLDWERDKAKELLAYLVDRRGAAVSSAEIALVLLGDDAKVRNVQTIISSLRKTLNSVGAGDVLIKRRNRTAIDVSKIQCDMYDFLDGDTRAERAYQGQYMSNYSWAEFTNGCLYSDGYPYPLRQNG